MIIQQFILDKKLEKTAGLKKEVLEKFDKIA